MKGIVRTFGVLVVVGVVVLFAASCSKGKAEGGAAGGPAGGGNPLTERPVNFKEVSETVLKMAKGYEDAKQQAPAGINIGTPPYQMFKGSELVDSGTVVKSTVDRGRTHTFVDVDGDGEADVTLDLVSAKAPADGAKINFKAKIDDVQPDQGKVMLTATAKEVKPAGG